MIRMLSVVVALSAAGILSSPGQADDKKEETVKVIKEWNGSNSGEEKKKRLTITKADEWKKIWAVTHSKMSPAPELPKIDFEKEMVVALFMGERNSGGYSVKVTKVVKTEKGLDVRVKETSPGKGGGALTVITYPYCIAVLPKSKGEVTFTDEK